MVCSSVLYEATAVHSTWHGMVWYGMVWYGMVWYGMVVWVEYIDLIHIPGNCC